MRRIAIISVHGCPLAQPGGKDTGGMSVYVQQLACELGELGLEVDVYTRSHDPQEPQIVPLSAKARVVHVQAGPHNASKRAIPAYLDTFLAGLRAFQQAHGLNYDLVHSHYWLSGRVAVALAREWKVPHIATFHTLAEIKRRSRVGEREPNLRISVEHQVAHSADRIVVSTSHEQRALRRLYGVPEEPVRVIPPGVDLGLFHPGSQEAARQRLGLNGEGVLLYVGRIEPIKGLEVLLHTMATMEGPDYPRLLVVGGGTDPDPEKERLKQLSRELFLDDRVDFLGSMEHHLLPLYYQAADVAVVPSYYESFGLVALEAMACGTPVVATRVGGLQSMVKDSRTGYLVPWHCPDAFADRLEVLLTNEALRKSMGSAAHTFATGMGWDRTAARVAGVYESLCGSTPRPAEP